MSNGRTRTLYPFDWLMIGYPIMLIFLILGFGRPLTEYAHEIIVYTALAGFAALIAYYFDDNAGRWQAAIRLLYPAVMFGIYYRTTGGMMFLFFDQFYDWQLTTFEKLIFGVNPTLYIDRHLLNVWVNEFFSLTYFLYYPMLPTFALVFLFRREYNVLKQAVFATGVAFFVSYLLFSLYPIEGPRWHYAAEYVNSIEGPIFRPMVELVIREGAVRGGCMPSSHVAVALVLMMYCFKYLRRCGWVLLPINIGLAIGTFWGRFHYVSDVLVGGLIGLFATLLTWKYHDRWLKPAYKDEEERIEESIECTRKSSI